MGRILNYLLSKHKNNFLFEKKGIKKIANNEEQRPF